MIRNFFVKIVFIIFTSGLLSACGDVNSTNQPLITESPTTLLTEKPPTNYPNCQSIKFSPTSGPEVPSLFRSVDNTDHIRGDTSARVTIVEYGDFQCPGCRSIAPILKSLVELYPDDLMIVFRQLPLYDIHDKALIAAQASEVASDEGKFWELHDFLYENYELWLSMPPDVFLTWLADKQLDYLSLDRDSFKKKINSQEIIYRVELALEEALRVGLRSTPFLLINGQIYNGPTDINSLKQVIELIILGDRQFTSCPEMTIDPLKQYIATLQTEKGDIVIQLYPDKSPLAVNSFVFLARNGWFDNITFHKVIEGFFAQSGDPSGTGLGGPGYIFDNEDDASLNFNQPGVLAMANSGRNTNGSQFFITASAQSELNGHYTIFGKVISGLDVLLQLSPVDTTSNNAYQHGDKLISVIVVEK